MSEHRDRPRQGVLLALLGIVAIVALLIVPLLLAPGSSFGGSDSAGAAAIQRIAPDYDVTWASNWWRPPGTETESMLFALQATAGGLLVGYAFGYLRGRKAAGAAAHGSGEGQ